MKKKEMQQWVCPVCGSNNVQVLAWVDVNNDYNVDWDSADNMSKYHCKDCENTFNRAETKVLKCFNGRPRIQGYQVVNSNGDIHPKMDASFCIYSLSQAKEMLDHEQWELLTIYRGDVEEPTLMFLGDPRQ